MWVFYKDDNIELNCITSTTRMVTLDIIYKVSNTQLLVHGVYCPANETEKPSFWNSLSRYFSNLRLPWILLGDFNEILHLQDKQGGRVPHVNRCSRLRNFLSSSHCVDGHCSGLAFSWKRRFQDCIVYEKLDRAVLSNSCLSLFPNLSIVLTMHP